MEIHGQKFMVNENNLNMWYLIRSYWIGSSTEGELHSNNCSGFSSTGGNGQTHENQNYFFKAANVLSCNSFAFLLCMCF